ncbi:hypothetical protein I314_04760 [Cryptococcus bacillisporus CA1873]|uniref:TPX2 central domain-containing protein n=1 Tax=Cryptococcus bacillisporus CA1873 TaxID=1296111 RepID=A0ABR5B6L5_CRYGA|nr:hypothetical protein I314_04760 [Cryptococcus bacillisporus CA1873]|eukprot:KIR59245.1 hypothetical protein I314_04760 [Cryptococcus gattii CA1873]
MKFDEEEKRISYRQQPSDESGNFKTLQKKKSFFGSANLKKKVKRLASQIMKGKPASPTAVATPLTELHPPLSAPQRKSQRMPRPPLHKVSHTLQDALPGGNKSTVSQVFPPKKPRKTASWPPPKNPQISSNRLPFTKQSNSVHYRPSNVYINDLRKAIKMDTGHMLNVPFFRAAPITRSNSYCTLQRQLARLQLCDEALTKRVQSHSHEKICADKDETNKATDTKKTSLLKQYPYVSFDQETGQSLSAISSLSSDGNPSGLSTPSLTNGSSQTSLFELKRVSSLPTTIRSEKSSHNEVLVDVSDQIFNRSSNPSISDFLKHSPESKHRTKRQSQKRKDITPETFAWQFDRSSQSERPRTHHPDAIYAKKVSKEKLNVGPVYPNQRRRPGEVGRAKNPRGPLPTSDQIPDVDSMLSIYAHF